VAADIGPGLAKAALAGVVDGVQVDTSYQIEADAELAIITDRDSAGLEIIRHSTAHLLAMAVQQLFPGAQVTIGPVIEDGFYYDFAYERPFTPEDLIAIEQRMGELAAANLEVSRLEMPRQQAIEAFAAMGEEYKHCRSPSRSRCIARVIGWICVVVPTCPLPAGSRHSS
jgi:threonyl-tRNA synthetase